MEEKYCHTHPSLKFSYLVFISAEYFDIRTEIQDWKWEEVDCFIQRILMMNCAWESEVDETGLAPAFRGARSVLRPTALSLQQRRDTQVLGEHRWGRGSSRHPRGTGVNLKPHRWTWTTQGVVWGSGGAPGRGRAVGPLSKDLQAQRGQQRSGIQPPSPRTPLEHPSSLPEAASACQAVSREHANLSPG